ncbi:hypothetical protein QE152_g38173 [Popillia japonica]|uniref:Uncharacterized protein n=1 Tax=Popillia japonica TaxID=7064 RepID=A0AAW1I8P9_POPJA
MHIIYNELGSSALIENVDDTVENEQSVLPIDDTIDAVQPLATAASNIENVVVEYEDNEKEIPRDRHVHKQQHEHEQILENSSSNTNTNCPIYVSPKDLMPVPTLKKKVGCRDGKPGKAALITSSPYLTVLETSINTNKKLKARRNLAKDNKTKNKNSVVRDIDEAGPSDLTVSKRQQRKRLPSSSSDESNEGFELQDSSDDPPIKVPTKSPEVDAACMFCH